MVRVWQFISNVLHYLNAANRALGFSAPSFVYSPPCPPPLPSDFLRLASAAQVPVSLSARTARKDLSWISLISPPFLGPSLTTLGMVKMTHNELQTSRTP